MKKLNHHPFKLIVVNIFFIAFLYSATACNAQSKDKKLLLALSKGDHTLSLVDPVTLQIIKRIPVGSDPHEVIASSDGKTAYVSIYGGGSLHELNIIDLVAQKPLMNVDTRPLFGPHGLTYVNDKVWFSAEGSKAVGRYDPATKKLDWSMGTGQDRTHMIYVTSDSKTVYTTNISSGTVSILDEAQPDRHDEWNQTLVPVAKGSEGFDVSPDSAELWTVSAENGNIYIVDLKAKKLSSQIDAKIEGANRLKFTPDGKTVLISSLRLGNLFIYDAQSRKEIKQLPIGSAATGILIDTDGSRAFVACSPDNYVAVIDLKTLKVTGHIDVGKNPDGLAWAVQP